MNREAFVPALLSGAFYGSATFIRHWSRRLIMSEGVEHLNANGAAWLADAIASHHSRKLLERCDGLIVWTLTRDPKNPAGAILTATDGNDGTPALVRQVIEFTDFPLDLHTDGFVLWVGDNGESEPATVYLPSEH